MDEERIRKFRKKKDAKFARTARETALFLVLPVLLPAAIFCGIALAGYQNFSANFFVPILGSFAIYLSTVFSLLFIIRQIKSSAKGTLQTIRLEGQKIGSIVDDKLSTTVNSLAGLLQVIEALADAYEDAVATFDSEPKALSNMIAIIRKRPDLFSDTVPEVAIHYFGAATITPTEDQIKDSDALEDYRMSPVERFRDVNNELHDCNVGIHRYLRFFDLPGFERRTTEVRALYIDWLENQIKLIKGNDRYYLVNARRAPRFLAIRNFVITHNSYIGILGKGDSGFQVNGEAFAEQQLAAALDYIRSSRKSWPTIYSQSGGLEDLEVYLKDLKECHEEALKDEQEDQ